MVTADKSGTVQFRRGKKPARSTAQAKRNGSAIPRAGLASSAIPHSRPYAIHKSARGDSAASRVSQTRVTASKTESDVSQIHSNGISTPAGRKAQAHPAAAATPPPATRRAMAQRGTVATAENMAFSNTAAKKLARVMAPKKRKIPNSRTG